MGNVRSTPIMRRKWGMNECIIDVMDLIEQSNQASNYYEDNILSQILFNVEGMPLKQYENLVFDYGKTLKEKDKTGRRIFVRLFSFLRGC